MKKEYEAPEMCIQKYELESDLCDSGVLGSYPGDIPQDFGGGIL